MSIASLPRQRTRKLGPADHGLTLTYQQFLAGKFEEGHKYELIEGRLYVSPAANLQHDRVRQHIQRVLMYYMDLHPDIVQYVSSNTRVFVPDEQATTCPEPDFSVYRTFPQVFDLTWEDVSPIVVVEIVSGGDAGKDYVRNVDLYQRVPSIREYWVFDRCSEVTGPTLRVYHRTTGKQKWKTADYGPQDVYTTKLLPGLKLPVCPPK